MTVFIWEGETNLKTPEVMIEGGTKALLIRPFFPLILCMTKQFATGMWRVLLYHFDNNKSVWQIPLRRTKTNRDQRVKSDEIRWSIRRVWNPASRMSCSDLQFSNESSLSSGIIRCCWSYVPQVSEYFPPALHAIQQFFLSLLRYPLMTMEMIVVSQQRRYILPPSCWRTWPH